MKFWGWMHHKFRENSKEPFKDATTGNSYSILSAHSSIDRQDVYPAACAGYRYNTSFGKQLNLFQERSFTGPMENSEEKIKDERNSNFFDGFLAIGTLGGEIHLNEPVTPTFGMSFEETALDNADVTENDLKLISNELEKFIGAEAKQGHHQPSETNSDYIPIASTIEAIERLDAEEDNKPMKFPLQEYLFGSLNEFPETKIPEKKERTSLGELFQIAELQDKKTENMYGKKQKQTSSAHKSGKHFVKKILKKIHLSSRSADNGKTEVNSTKNKFQKMVQVFHRKVHPENSIMEREIRSSMANPINSKSNTIDFTVQKVKHCHDASKRCIQYELRSSRSAKNREHWINTDEDYFVLEL